MMPSGLHMASQGPLVFECFATDRAFRFLGVTCGRLVPGERGLARSELLLAGQAGRCSASLLLVLPSAWFLGSRCLALRASLLQAHQGATIRSQRLHLLHSRRLDLHRAGLSGGSALAARGRTAPRGLLALPRQHLVDGHEAEPQVLGPDLALLRVLALDVVLQTRLVRELPLAGDALVDRRRGRVPLAVATLIQLLGVFSARRQLLILVL